MNPSFPHLGATPDGIISCDCCGKGLIEIKCPFKHRDKHPHEIPDWDFYLQQDEGREFHLRDDHEYYYLIQGQLAVYNMEYCDFICWTPYGMHCERILQDPEHFYDIMKPALDKFFMAVLLSRLLTGSNLAVAKPVTANHATNTYCWCGGRDEGKMVACDNASCQREWFHFQCVTITRNPRGK